MGNPDGAALLAASLLDASVLGVSGATMQLHPSRGSARPCPPPGLHPGSVLTGMCCHSLDMQGKPHLIAQERKPVENK